MGHARDLISGCSRACANDNLLVVVVCAFSFSSCCVCLCFFCPNGKPIINLKKKKISSTHSLYRISISNWYDNKLCYSKAIRKGRQYSRSLLQAALQQLYLCDSTSFDSPPPQKKLCLFPTTTTTTINIYII